MSKKGMDGLEEIREINRVNDTIKVAVAKDFPIDNGQVNAMCEEISANLLNIYEIEKSAIENLRELM